MKTQPNLFILLTLCGLVAVGGCSLSNSGSENEVIGTHAGQTIPAENGGDEGDPTASPTPTPTPTATPTPSPTPTPTGTPTPTPTPPPSGGSSGFTTLAASRTSGVAPLAVFFHGIGSLPWAQIEASKFSWNFGDGQGGGNNFFTGYQSAYVFERPGTYTVTLTVEQNGVVIDNLQQQITVADFSGRTLCVSSAGNFSGCPSSAAADHFTNLDAAWPQVASNTQLLVRRGENHSLAHGYYAPASIDSVLVGAFGAAGARPRLTMDPTQLDAQLFDPYGDDWRFVGLELVGPYVPGSTPPGQNPPGGNSAVGFDGNNKLILDVIARRMIARAFGVGNGYRGLFVVDSTGEDTGRYGVYTSAAHEIVVLRSTLRNGDGASASIRNYSDNVLVANSQIYNDRPSSWAMRFCGRPYPSYVLVTGVTAELIGSGSGNSPHLSMGPCSGYETNEVPINGLLAEKNRFITRSGSYPPGEVDIRGGSNITVRNNIFDGGGRLVGFFALSGTPAQYLPFHSIHLFGNTLYNNGAYMGVVGGNGTPVNDFQVRNNVISSPNCTSECGFGSDGAGALVANHNLLYLPQRPQFCVAPNGTATCFDPQIVNPAGGDFHVQSTSPAIDAGAVIQSLFEDMVGNPRPQSQAPDLGAYESN